MTVTPKEKVAHAAGDMAMDLLRRMLTVFLPGVIIFGPAFLSVSCREGPAPGSRPAVVRHLTVYGGKGEYCAWPDIARTPEGDLIVVFCRSEEHLGPDGEILLARSTDNGTTWQEPRVIFNTTIDDRESGLTPLADGRIIGHFWSTFHTPEFYSTLQPGSYEEPVIARWQQTVREPAYRAARDTQGAWCAITVDGGRTWSQPVRGKDAVHGGIQLSDGSLLVASYREFGDSVGVFSSARPGDPWLPRSLVGPPEPDSLSFGEPHLLQLRSGRVIMMIRATAKPYNDQDPRCVLWESYSDDGGRSWVRPYPTGLWGFPPQLTLLSDGRVLCSYGYRRPPFGERACLSPDGVRWNPDDEIILRDDAPNIDLGYPASVEIEPGVVLTVYYQPDVPAGTVQRMRPPDPERVKPGILGTIWRVPGSVN